MSLRGMGGSLIDFLSRKIRIWGSAIASDDKAIGIKEDDHQAWYNRGVALSDLGRNEEAIVSYDKALEIKTSEPYPWKGRGVALMRLERYEESIESFNRAIALKPDYARAVYSLACCYGLQGNVERTIEHLGRAIELNTENQELAKTDSDFDAIREDARFRALVERQAGSNVE